MFGHELRETRNNGRLFGSKPGILKRRTLPSELERIRLEKRRVAVLAQLRTLGNLPRGTLHGTAVRRGRAATAYVQQGQFLDEPPGAAVLRYQLARAELTSVVELPPLLGWGK